MLLPAIRPVLLVVLLYRTLDTVRVFDTVFIQTNGANGTETLSLLAYDQLAGRLNLGLGSAVSTLLFLLAAAIAVGFVWVFRADLRELSRGGRPMRRGSAGTPARSRPRGRAAAGAVDRLAVAEVAGHDHRQAAWPVDPTLENYRSIAGSALFTRALLNSVGIGLITTVLAVALATPAAYALTRLRFRGKALVLPLTLAVAVFPPMALVGPLFDLWRALGLYDTWPGLIIPYLSFALPLAMWTLTAFFRGLPWEMEEAAQADGATPGQAFRRVLVPLARPGVLTAAILVFFFAWNDVVFAISLTSSDRSRTVPAALAFFPGRRAVRPAGRQHRRRGGRGHRAGAGGRRWSSSAGWSPGSPPAWLKP